MIYVGIDPGLQGCIAVLNDGGHCEFHDMPTLRSGASGKRVVDAYGVAEIIGQLPADVHVALEQQQSMPKQGVASSFITGMNYGLLVGILASKKISTTLVRANVWKRRMLEGVSEGKDQSVAVCKRLFPASAEHLTRVRDHNRAEALLLAEYGRRITGAHHAIGTVAG